MSSPADRSPARLVLQTPDGQEMVYGLEQGRTVTLGRDAGNTIVLNSQFVSKRHALVSWSPRGVRIEDQDSANGIVVNGLTVHAAQLSNGDLIQLGDQTLLFEAEGQAAAAPAPVGGSPARPVNKGLRLILAAVLTMLLMGIGLLAVYLFVLAPAAAVEAVKDTGRDNPSLPADTPISPVDTPQAQAVEQQAMAAKDRPVDWLYDEGNLAYRNGRLLDAYRLLHGALYRDAQHAPSRRLLLRVMGERNLRLRSFQSAATRAEEELKFEDAARQWEQVQALTLDSEPLHARARTEVTRLHQRAAQ
ncbi:MAG TPA: FHA domain-containing protein [Luteitalea sp.]|nr:FHA domain-containing protein [Luteitalea sp.]